MNSLFRRAGSLPPRRPSPLQRASALIIVLGCLAIISIMVVAFFSSAATERQSAKIFANGSSVKLLADSTVDIVMGQIKDATKGVDASGTTTLAWASQPGMIRTYNATSAQAVGYYKLYSWANMMSPSFTPTDPTEMPPANWTKTPALYTDLNDPVAGVYPIVDPAAVGSVKGFSITNAPVSTSNAAPMPVQWLYVLQDGSLATATGGVGNTATVTTTSMPGVGASNPIVGRIAFWTDDDTSKVNINTAAGDVWTEASSPPAIGAPGNPGSFWDIPRTANTTFERTLLARFQPAKNEYQRYPGHPATTYLSAVFPNITTNNIVQIAPRINGGGSGSGTKVATASIVPDGDRLYASVDELMFSANRSVQPNLPSSANAFTASNLEQAKFFLTAHSRAPEVNLFNQPRVVIWPESVQNDTTHRTPYDSLIAFCGTLNRYLYYFQRGVFVANNAGADSQSKDLPTTATSAPASDLTRNRQLITYLRNLTSLPIPGISTNSTQTFLGKYSRDRDQILTEIFDYIRAANAQDTSIPGLVPYTTTSASVNGTAGQGQILPITDTTHSDLNTTTLRGFGRFPTVREAGLVFVGVGQTQGANKSIPPMASQSPGTAIADGKTRVQAFFYLNFFDPSQGYALSVPNFQVRVSQLNAFKWAGTSMGFPAAPATSLITRNANTGNYGGYKGATMYINGSLNTAVTNGKAPVISGYIDLNTNSSAVPTSFVFEGGDITVEIMDSNVAAPTVLQALTIKIPGGTFPVPYLAPLLSDVKTGLTIDYRNLAAYTGSFGAAVLPVGRFTGSCNANTSSSSSGKMWICGRDVVRSVVANTDLRLIAAKTNVPNSYFGTIEPDYSNSPLLQVHSVAEAENGAGTYPYIGCNMGKFVANADYGVPGGSGAPTPVPSSSDFYYPGTATTDGLQPNAKPAGNQPDLALPAYSAPIAFGVNAASCMPINGVYAGTNKTGPGLSYPPGDYDTGMSIINDGAFINKVDEGSITNLASGSSMAYYDGLSTVTLSGATFFSPNRQMPSPVMFGSLPTGVQSNQPWQTLLFRPDPGGAPQHVGAQIPPDYLLLDLFNMPIVEPYAISDPFSTAGKINMNYQIVPFTYMNRTTALRAVMKSEQILTLRNTDSSLYKTASMPNRRNFLDLDQTLVGFQNRFDSGDIFRSASEICSIWLVPQGQSYSAMQSFWSNNLLTGDNVRERPYADIYPRLTTKSNTFTVHYRVQMLKKMKSTSANQWVEGTDLVTAEFRGSSTIERYLDTSDTTIPDYATATQTPPPTAIDTFYKFRVIETKQFTP